jgi:hypothetical protein
LVELTEKGFSSFLFWVVNRKTSKRKETSAKNQSLIMTRKVSSVLSDEYIERDTEK